MGNEPSHKIMLIQKKPLSIQRIMYNRSRVLKIAPKQINYTVPKPSFSPLPEDPLVYVDHVPTDRRFVAVSVVHFYLQHAQVHKQNPP